MMPTDEAHMPKSDLLPDLVCYENAAILTTIPLFASILRIPFLARLVDPTSVGPAAE
jgi:hypothetical protein